MARASHDGLRCTRVDTSLSATTLSEENRYRRAAGPCPGLLGLASGPLERPDRGRLFGWGRLRPSGSDWNPSHQFWLLEEVGNKAISLNVPKGRRLKASTGAGCH